MIPTYERRALVAVAFLATLTSGAVAQGINPKAVLPPPVERNADPIADAGLIDPLDGILTSGNPKITVMAFIDRGSPSSVAAMPILIALVATDPRVKLVLKELPLVSQGSVDAARVAVAARMQGQTKFKAFEAAMLHQDRTADLEIALAAASAAGFNMAELSRDLKRPDILSYLKEVRSEAEKLHIEGTPTYLVGRQALVGLQGLARLRQAVKKQLQN